jgi:hypothetical protein
MWSAVHLTIESSSALTWNPLQIHKGYFISLFLDADLVTPSYPNLTVTLSANQSHAVTSRDFVLAHIFKPKLDCPKSVSFQHNNNITATCHILRYEE